LKLNVHFIIMGLGLALITLCILIATSEIPLSLYLGLGIFALILTIAILIQELSIDENKKTKFSMVDVLFLAAAPIAVLLATICGGMFGERDLNILNNAISLVSVGFLLLSISLKVKD
jgi:predicted MFS family arabinose efflux permease